MNEMFERVLNDVPRIMDTLRNEIVNTMAERCCPECEQGKCTSNSIYDNATCREKICPVKPAILNCMILLDDMSGGYSE